MPAAAGPFLVTLLYESDLRIGEALGLRHADLDPAACAVHVVAREGNPNHARVKGMKDRAVPVRDYLFNRYADYLDAEYGDLTATSCSSTCGAAREARR